MRRLLIIGLMLGLSACNCGSPGTDPEHDPDGGNASGTGDGGEKAPAACLDGLGPIQISPADSTVTLGANPSPVAFTATGARNGGANEDLTTQLKWIATRD